MWSKAALLVLVFTSAAWAQIQPVIFERETITITAPTIQSKKDDEMAMTLHPPLAIDVEIRPEDALRLEYIHMLNNLTDSSGVMIAFLAPSVVALPPLKVPTPVDALFVMNDGKISQILPNVLLSDLNQEIVAKEPIKAFLFLKAGMVARSMIRPGDIVSGRKFTPAPPLMQ